MIQVQKGNRQLTIEESLLTGYLEKGYCQIDRAGKVVRQGAVKDPKQLAQRAEQLEKEREALKKKLSEMGKKAKELEAENAALKNRLEAVPLEKKE